MSFKNTHSQHHGTERHPPIDTTGEIPTQDPVCGMTVDPRTALSQQHGGEKYYFCSALCRDKFAENPAKYLRPASPHATHVAPHGKAVSKPPATIWTCPMHPEVRRDAPGRVPDESFVRVRRGQRTAFAHDLAVKVAHTSHLAAPRVSRLPRP